MRILLVEDHASLRELTASHLAARGFVVDTAASLAVATFMTEVARYDALVIDLGLPDGDGAELLGQARRSADRRGQPPPPALILTARDSLEDRLAGLNGGADDYVVKPFRVEELEARLRAVLRRPGARHDRELRLGSLVFDTVSRDIRVEGRPCVLRRREALVLETLLHARGRIVVRDALQERLYGIDEPVTSNALEMAVSRLRRALLDVGSDVCIETQRGVGYRAVAPAR